MSTIDKNILSLLQQQKQKGMLMLFEHYYKPLVLLADMYLTNNSISEDIVQEQFVKFWDKKLYLHVKNHSALKNYLFTMVKNASLNVGRNKDILRESFNLYEMEISESTARSMTEEGILTIKNAIAELPVQTRKVVECVIIQNMKYQEAANELDISINTIKTQLKRGVSKLKQTLSDKKDILYLFLFCKSNQDQQKTICPLQSV